MGSKTPEPGKCGARLRGERAGTFCTNDPAPTATTGRCRLHGGASTGAPITHGLHSVGLRLRYADQETRDRLDELVADPSLLDVRRAVAVSQTALETIPWEPSDGEARRLAKAILDREPTEAEIANAFNELRARYAERVVVNANRHASTVSHAAKLAKIQEILLRGARPIMRRFAERVAGIVKKYIPPTQQAAFLKDLRQVIEETELEFVRLEREADS